MKSGTRRARVPDGVSGKTLARLHERIWDAP